MKTGQKQTAGQKLVAKAKEWIQTGKNQQAKQELESVLRSTDNKLSQDPEVMILCGQANMNLGYLIIAEQLFTKAHYHPGFEARSLRLLGELAHSKKDYPKALHFWQQSLTIETTWDLAYQTGLLLKDHMCDTSMALEHFSLAIDLA